MHRNDAKRNATLARPRPNSVSTPVPLTPPVASGGIRRIRSRGVGMDETCGHAYWVPMDTAESQHIQSRMRLTFRLLIATAAGVGTASLHISAIPCSASESSAVTPTQATSQDGPKYQGKLAIEWIELLRKSQEAPNERKLPRRLATSLLRFP